MKKQFYPFDVVLLYNYDEQEPAERFYRALNDQCACNHDLYLDGDKQQIVHIIRCESRLSWLWYHNLIRGFFRKLQQFVCWTFRKTEVI